MRLMRRFVRGLMHGLGFHTWMWVREYGCRTRVCARCGKAQYWLREWEDI